MINLQKNEFTIEVLKYYRYNINYYGENNIVAYKNTKEEKQKMQKNEDFEKKMEKNKALNTENEISKVKEKLAASDTKISEEKEDITEEKKVSSANSVGKEKAPKVEKETKVDEATVIEKIKNFIAKIVAMQEEAKKETLDKDESNEKVEKVDKASKEKNNDNAYIGYMYGQAGASTYTEAHANINDSTIKTIVDNWYKTNIVDKGYSDKVADVIYCNDRKVYTGSSWSGYGTLGYGTNATTYEPASRALTWLDGSSS